MYKVYVRNKFEALRDEAEINSIETAYDRLRIAIEVAGSEKLPNLTRSPKCPWMTEAILTLMDDRRKSKGRNEQLYRDLNRIIYRECRLAKERWTDERVPR